MACTTEQTISPMIHDLLSHGHEFSFPQVMRIARMHLGDGGAGELPEIPWQERLRVRPDLSLAFPAADVARVERTGQNGDDLLITTTFLGLYGSSEQNRQWRILSSFSLNGTSLDVASNLRVKYHNEQIHTITCTIICFLFCNNY